jgi:hypothetical protein
MRVRRDRARSNPDLETFDNPSVFGTNVGDTAESVAGLVATAILNDKLISPLTRGFTSGLKSANNTVGQLVDAATTLFAAQLVGMVGAKVAGAGAGRRMAEGGGLYGIGKVVTAFVPSLSISAQYPDYFQGISIFGPTAPAALGPGTSMGGTIQPSYAAAASDSMGF